MTFKYTHTYTYIYKFNGYNLFYMFNRKRNIYTYIFNGKTPNPLLCKFYMYDFHALLCPNNLIQHTSIGQHVF